MASTNTSLKTHGGCFLRLEDNQNNSHQDYSLYEAKREPGRFVLVPEGVVYEAHEYNAMIICERPIFAEKVSLYVNGEELWDNASLLPESTPEPENRKACHFYRIVLASPNQYLFRMTYGFAVVEIEFLFSDGSRKKLMTHDIPCACERGNQEQLVSEMLAALTTGGSDAAIRWMLSPSIQTDSEVSFAEGAVVFDASKSLRSYLELCERTLTCYEANLGYFRAHAYSRVSKRDEIVSTRSVRFLGRRELQWLARTPEALYEAKTTTAIRLNDRYYIASEIQTERRHRSFDNDENRSLLSFSAEIASSLDCVSNYAQKQVERLQEIGDSLKMFDEGKGLLPALVVVDVCLKRELPLIKRLDNLKDRALRIRQSMARLLQNVSIDRYRLPRRSKVFQEIRPYAAVYSQMKRWEEFGRFELLRDGLALHTWKMDKLYEYYVLFRLLGWLSDAGFTLDDSVSNPARQIRYTIESDYYQNEEQIANVYDLARGDERIRLYYEPVLYGDLREEGDLRLHRTTSKKSFDSDSGDRCWTPDFLLLYSDGFGIEKRFIFDAKLRTVGKVRGNGSDNDAKSCFGQCILKYKYAIEGPDGKGIDALWLLCGRTSEPTVLVNHTSSWSRSESKTIPDGIATLSPQADRIGDVFCILGIKPTDELKQISD